MIKKFIAATLAVVMAAGIIPILPANAFETDAPYPYTMFAGSEEDGAITINAGNICINGSIVTNGTLTSDVENLNVNGQILEHAQQSIIYAFGKLDHAYFDFDNILTVDTDYTVEDINISLDEPVVSMSRISLSGNVNLNTQLKAEQNIQITGDSCNANNAALISHYGDIYIDSENFDYSGLIYAPYGDIVIESSYTNLNNVIVIGQTITIECSNLNVNYNTNVANVIGTISEDPNNPYEDDYLYALGYYNEEINAIDISWSGNHLPDSVDIMVSDDGDDYTLASTATNVSVYSYPVGDDFISAYFKVSYTGTNGNNIESLPFQAFATKNGIVIDYPDSDGDSISDIIESILKTDPFKEDTDGDGLTDPQELFITVTDPLVYDSVEPNVSDADADIDADGISNIDEIEFGTDPNSNDTDDDDLTDREEIYVYQTDASNEDSDSDGLNDGDELQLGLNPMQPITFNCLDSEYPIRQTLYADNAAFSNINTDDNPYSMNIELTTNRLAESVLSINKSQFSGSIANPAILGECVDISIDSNCNPSDIVIKYEIKEEYITNELGTYLSIGDLEDIKRLCVFHFDEMQNMLLPIDTEYDIENNTVIANVNELGTYCIMDMELWFTMLGFSPDTLITEAEILESTNGESLVQDDSWWYIDDFEEKFTQSNVISPMMKAPSPLPQYTTYTFNDHKYAIFDLGVSWDECKEYCESLGGHLATITSSEEQQFLEESVLPHGNKKSYYIGLFRQAANQPHQWITGEPYNYRNWDNGEPNNPSRELVVHMYKTAGTYGKWNDTLNYSAGNMPYSTVNAGCICEWDENEIPTEYDVIIGLNYKKLTLQNPIEKDGLTNSDTDELTDWQEIDQEKVNVQPDGTIVLPKLYSLLSVSDIENILIKKFGQGYVVRVLTHKYQQLRVLPCISDPTREDTDGDKLNDDEEDYLSAKPLSWDTDHDGLYDGDEVELWFDPTDANPDGDNYNDNEELQNNTSPYVYNKTAVESAKAFLKGGIIGDFETPDSIEGLCGQVAFSFVPVAADARDYFANVFVNESTGSAILNVVGCVLDLLPLVGSAGDVAKAFPKITKFIVQHADDASKAIEAIIQVAKQFPHSDEVVMGVAKILPIGAIDNILDSLKNGSKFTSNDYAKLINVCEAAGKSADEVVECTKFRSFRALKKYLGDPGLDNLGRKKEWHHIVEQCQAKAKRSGFDVSDINQVSNIMATPKDVHKEISKFYSSSPGFANGKTVRDWLNGQSFEAQYEFGLKYWKDTMISYGYSVD